MATIERKSIVAQPAARLVFLESQPALPLGGITIERYATVRGGYIYEKHTDPSGIVHWFRVERVTVRNG